MTEKDMKAAETEGFEKKFKMTATLGTGNMVCFDLNGKIKRYSNAEEILTDFFHKRLEFYGLRKVSILSWPWLTLSATPRRRAQQAV
jgi:DNA topoisomerase-2